jgi:dipeptidyl aminopeptidase/acylaminoacyl peptidase
VPTIGGAPQKILFNLDTPVTFSPDGRRMAFMRDDPAERRSVLEIANVDGSGRTRLAEVIRPDRILNNPGRLAWSPDGTTIAAPVLIGPGQSIALFDAATGAMRMISQTRWTVANGVQWLPGGQSLIASYREGNTATAQLGRVDAGSGAATTITRDLFASSDLSAAADGGSFVATASLGESTLWVAEAASLKQPAQITTGAADAEGAKGVEWMPGGSIVYASRASGNLDLWILDPKTGTRRQLTSHPADDLQPSISPDGRSIAFVSGREGGNHIWVMHVDGTEPRAISTAAQAASPFWTPDGEAILLRRGAGEPRWYRRAIGERRLAGEGGRVEDLHPTRDFTAGPVGRVRTGFRTRRGLAAGVCPTRSIGAADAAGSYFWERHARSCLGP